MNILQAKFYIKKLDKILLFVIIVNGKLYLEIGINTLPFWVKRIKGAQMKRFITGICCALIGWTIGSHFSNLWSWTGAVVSFLLGLVFGNVKKTKEIIIETWNKTMFWGKNYRWDWKGTMLYFGVIFLFFLTMINWCFSTNFFGEHTKNVIVDSILGFIVFFVYGIMVMFSFISIAFLLVSMIEAYRQLNPKKMFLGKKVPKKELLVTLFWMQPQILTVVGIVALVYGLYKLGKGILLLVYNIPSIFIGTVRLLARILCFVARCLTRLISEEKELTFAICTASGTALGLYFGREIICGVSGSVIAGILILISDKTRVWLEKKQGNCVCNT